MALTLGQAVRKIRENAGELQGYTADVLGITNVYLCQIETGRAVPSEKILELIRGLYGFCPRLLVALSTIEEGVTDKRLATVTAHRELLGLTPD